LKPHPDSPDVLRPQWPLLSDKPALVSRLKPGTLDGIVFPRCKSLR
jgi:hypothetical protein